MLVGNKVDKESDRVVSKKVGIDFARVYGCLFLECSAKTRVNVEECFEGLVLKILETPILLVEGSAVVKRNNIFKQKPPLAVAAEAFNVVVYCSKHLPEKQQISPIIRFYLVVEFEQERFVLGAPAAQKALCHWFH